MDKHHEVSNIKLLVIPDGVNNVRFAMEIDGKFHRYLGNEKVYSVSKLVEYSGRAKKQISADRWRRGTFTLGGVLLGSFVWGKMRFNNIVMNVSVLAGLVGLGVWGAHKLHDFIFVNGDERAHFSFFTSAQVTSDAPVVYITDDPVLALADFEDGLDESQAGVERRSE